VWHGADRGAPTDASVVSPALHADPAAPVTITIRHAYSFESSGGTSWDGGVVELSTDGTTWNDVTTYVATSPYTGTLTTMSGNPLGGRAAFAGANAAYPAPATLTLDLGTKLAGKTFQLRFRIATDQASGDAGWTIHSVAVTGLVGTPFPSQVADTGTCTPGGGDAGTTPATDGGGCCQGGPGPAGPGLLALGVLGVLGVRGLAWRRRRTGAR
jgi:hypothetical protein